jgi:hypothetical protein
MTVGELKKLLTNSDVPASERLRAIEKTSS